MNGNSGKRVPASIRARCDECGEALHRVLKGRDRGGSTSLVLKCSGCGRVSSVQACTAPERKLPIIISWLSESERAEISLDSTETVAVGDEFVVNDLNVIITGIESRGRRPRKCRVPEIDTLWAKRFDRVRVKVSLRLTRGRNRSADFLASPDDIFTVGDTIDVDGQEICIYSIKKYGRPIREGSAKAVDITRVYAEKPEHKRKRQMRL
jgi:uncharacterized Zn finger protein